MEVVKRSHIAKGTFKMEASQFKTVPTWGGSVNMPMFTPERVDAIRQGQLGAQ